jgi:hypothetical protein
MHQFAACYATELHGKPEPNRSAFADSIAYDSLSPANTCPVENLYPKVVFSIHNTLLIVMSLSYAIPGFLPRRTVLRSGHYVLNYTAHVSNTKMTGEEIEFTQHKPSQ